MPLWLLQMLLAMLLVAAGRVQAAAAVACYSCPRPGLLLSPVRAAAVRSLRRRPAAQRQQQRERKKETSGCCHHWCEHCCCPVRLQHAEGRGEER